MSQLAVCWRKLAKLNLVETVFLWVDFVTVHVSTADPTFPSVGALGGQAFVRPVLYWAGVYPGVPGYTPVQCSNGRQKPCLPSGALGGKVGSDRF